jgi:hypothetical protein
VPVFQGVDALDSSLDSSAIPPHDLFNKKERGPEPKTGTEIGMRVIG